MSMRYRWMNVDMFWFVIMVMVKDDNRVWLLWLFRWWISFLRFFFDIGTFSVDFLVTSCLMLRYCCVLLESARKLAERRV